MEISKTFELINRVIVCKIIALNFVKMVAKVAVVFLASCVVVLASPVPTVFDNRLSNLPQNVQFVKMDPASIGQSVGEITDRFSNAYVVTFDQQKQGLDNIVQSVSNLGQKAVDTGINVVKSGLDLIFIIPTFGRHVLSNN